MNIHSYSKDLNKAIQFYLDKLPSITEENFQKTPKLGEWSYSEVYQHLIAANGISLTGLEKCLDGTAKLIDRPTDWRVRLILYLGKLPPGDFKIPAILESTIKKIDKAEAERGMKHLLELLDRIMSRIHLAPINLGVKHPRMGYLNAFQWIRFMQIHTNHHIKQLKRIEIMLKKVESKTERR